MKMKLLRRLMVKKKNKTRLNNLGLSKLLPDNVIYEPEKITQSIISTNVKDLVRFNNITSKKIKSR